MILLVSPLVWEEIKRGEVARGVTGEDRVGTEGSIGKLYRLFRGLWFELEKYWMFKAVGLVNRCARVRVESVPWGRVLVLGDVEANRASAEVVRRSLGSDESVGIAMALAGRLEVPPEVPVGVLPRDRAHGNVNGLIGGNPRAGGVID